MGKLFDIDNRVMCFLSRITDMFILSILIILFSIPVITLSPAVIAASRVIQNIIHNEDCNIAKTFLIHFKSNLKQGIFCSIITCLSACIYFLNIFWMIVPQSSASVIQILIGGFFSVIYLGTFIRLHILIARYNNPLRRHLYNAFILTCWHFLRSFLISIVASLPVLAFLLFPQIFLRFLPLLTMLFPSAALYLINLIVTASFQQIETLNAQNQDISSQSN